MSKDNNNVSVNRAKTNSQGSRYIFRGFCSLIITALAAGSFLWVWLDYIYNVENRTKYLKGIGNIGMSVIIYIRENRKAGCKRCNGSVCHRSCGGIGICNDPEQLQINAGFCMALSAPGTCPVSSLRCFRDHHELPLQEDHPAFADHTYLWISPQ